MDFYLFYMKFYTEKQYDQIYVEKQLLRFDE